jgi:hypothetical protein
MPLLTGLYVISESDSPLEVHTVSAAALPEAVASIAAGRSPVESQPEWDLLLTRQAVVYDYHTPEQRARAKTFDQIRELLGGHLSNMQAIKIGEVQRLYAVGGQSADGQWVVLTCELIET